MAALQKLSALTEEDIKYWLLLRRWNKLVQERNSQVVKKQCAKLEK